jgi:hypothetical protein
MDSHLPRKWTIPSRREILAGLVLAALAPAGCLDKHLTRKDGAPAPPAPPALPDLEHRLVSVWDNKLNYSSDLSRGGAPMPVLVGRVFLFGPDFEALQNNNPTHKVVKSYIGDGSLIVDLYDNTPHRGPETEAMLIDELRVDAATLKKFAKTDVFGDGYTIMFPWYTYRPDISNVYIIMRYTFPDGKFIVHQSDPLTINHAEAQERMRKRMPITNPAMRMTNLPPTEEVLPPPAPAGR